MKSMFYMSLTLVVGAIVFSAPAEARRGTSISCSLMREQCLSAGLGNKCDALFKAAMASGDAFAGNWDNRKLCTKE